MISRPKSKKYSAINEQEEMLCIYHLNLFSLPWLAKHVYALDSSLILVLHLVVITCLAWKDRANLKWKNKHQPRKITLI